jgi:tetratricopeptide (TPR) repeat protein
MGGYMLSESGKPEAALRFYRRALSNDQSLGVAHVNLGKLLFEKRQFAEALAAFEAAATLTPGDADAWRRRCQRFRASPPSLSSLSRRIRPLRASGEITMSRIVSLKLTFRGPPDGLPGGGEMKGGRMLGEDFQRWL